MMIFKNTIILPFSFTFLATLSVNSYAKTSLIGMEDIHPLGQQQSQSSLVSADGKVVIGLVGDGVYSFASKNINGQGNVKITFINNSNSQAIAISADGRVVVGLATDETGYQKAFKYTDEGGIINLGTLGGTSSDAVSVSSSGDVIVGNSMNKFYTNRGFKYTDSTGMVDIGDLGGSATYVQKVSADGSTIVGTSQGIDGLSYAFKYTDAGLMTNIHSLGTNSYAMGVSADGQVIAGRFTTAQYLQRVFKYTDSTGMVDIGSLGNNTVNQFGAFSKDGSTIVGSSSTDSGEQHAYKHTDVNGIIDLGTLGGTLSVGVGVSANGVITVGYSETASGGYNAFAHADDAGMIDLGGLGGYMSIAEAVSEDGKVIIGNAMTEAGVRHAVLWRLNIPSASVTNPELNVTLVDVDNTHTAMAKTASQAYSVLDLHSSRLGALAQQDCIANAGAGSICIGAFTSVADSKHANQSNVGLNMAYQIDDNWRAGLAMDTLVGSSLPDNYKRNSSTTPGMGAFIQYQTQADGTGFNSRLSGSYAKEKLEISRELLEFTEAGKGDADLSGWRGELSFNYGIDVNSVLFTPHIDFVYSQVKRDAYQEDREAEFKAIYGEMGEKRTSVRLGQKIQAPLSQWVTADLDVGIDLSLDRQRDAFTGQVDYIGAYLFDRGDERKYRPYASLGANIYPTKNSAVRVGSSWFKQSYGTDVFGLSLSYSYSF